MEKKQSRRTIPTRLTSEDIKKMKAVALELSTTSIDIATIAIRLVTQTEDGREVLADEIARQKKDSLPY